MNQEQQTRRLKKINSQNNLAQQLNLPNGSKTNKSENNSDTSSDYGFKTEADNTTHRQCTYHPEEKLTMICSDLFCASRGPICHICLVYDHYDHQEKSGDLNFYLKQIRNHLKQHEVGKSSQEDINDMLIDFKYLIDQQKQKIIQNLQQIDEQAKNFIQQIKEYGERDTQQIIEVINKIKDNSNKMNTIEYTKRIGDLTQYFEFYPHTKQIYRKDILRELFLNKIQKILTEKSELIFSNLQTVYTSLYKIQDSLTKIKFPQEKIQEFPKINLDNLERQQKIQNAHQNWIRNVISFEMTDCEIEALGIKQDIIDNVCIVTCGDDMSMKFWINFQGEGLYNFKLHSEIIQAHDKEIFVLKAQIMNNVVKKKLMQQCSDCSNVILSGQNGKIKVWNWIQKKCINEIQTKSQFLNDFILLEHPHQRIVFNSGGKNLLEILDWVIFGGLTVKQIHPRENGKEIVSLCRIGRKTSTVNMNITQIRKKIDAFHQKIIEDRKMGQKNQNKQLDDDFLESDIVNGDLIAVTFATVQGTVKVYNQNGDCLNTIYRNDKDWSVCLETMKVLKYYPQSTFGENQQYALVIASDNRTLTVYTNKQVYKIENAHQGWIRGLAVWEVNDGLNLKNIIMSAADNDSSIKLWDGLDGSLLKVIKASHSGLRWRSLHCYQENYKPNNKNYIVYGSKNGTLFIFSLPFHKK